MKYSGGAISGFLGSRLFTNTEPNGNLSALKTGPLQPLEPIDETRHTITAHEDHYLVRRTWPNYFRPSHQIVETQIKYDDFNDMPETQLRNPLRVYEESLNSPTARHTAKKLEHDILVAYEKSNNIYMGDVNSILIPEISRYVQYFEYRVDSSFKSTFPDYAQYPTETLYLGFGDCEDSAILFTSLVENLDNIDIRTGLGLSSNHLFPLIAIPDLFQSNKYETYTHINGTPYTAIDTVKPYPIHGTSEQISADPSLTYSNGEIHSIDWASMTETMADVVDNFLSGL